MLEQRPLRIDEHIESLESMRIRDAEEYNLVKIKLETDVQTLEQQIQQVCYMQSVLFRPPLSTFIDESYIPAQYGKTGI